jgi:hypothetical protein
MRIIGLFLFLSVCVPSGLKAQEIQTQVLHTLANNEKIIFQDEYRLGMHNNEKFQAIFLQRDHQYVAIINGKEYGPYDYLDIHDMYGPEDGAFYYEYKDAKGEKYIHMVNNNQHYGPYNNGVKAGMNGNQEVWVSGSISQNKIKPGTKGIDYFLHFKGKKYGPYSNHTYVLGSNGKYMFQYWEKEKSFINYSGEILGPYDKHIYPKMHEDGTYTFKYEKEGKVYRNDRGNITGPITVDNENFDLDDGKLKTAPAVVKKAKEGQYVKYKGKVLGPYKEVEGVMLYDKKKLGFAYMTKEDKVYVYKNGKSLGPFTGVLKYYGDYFSINDDGFFMLQTTSSGGSYGAKKYAFENGRAIPEGEFFSTKMKGGSYYLLTKSKTDPVVYTLRYNNKELGKFTKYFYPKLDEEGKISFGAWKGGMWQVYEKGEFKGEYKSRPSITSDVLTLYKVYDNEQYIYNINGKDYTTKGTLGYEVDAAKKHYMVYSNYTTKPEYKSDFALIDGKEVKTDPPTYITFSEQENSFKWITLIGKDIVLNTYRVSE